MPMPTEYFGESLPVKLKGRLDLTKEINATYQFDLTGDGGGQWFVELLAETEPKVAAGENAEAKCTITMEAVEFQKLIEGQLNPQMAFMSGKLKVKGSMGLALKLQKVLGL